MLERFILRSLLALELAGERGVGGRGGNAVLVGVTGGRPESCLVSNGRNDCESSASCDSRLSRVDGMLP